GGGSGGGAPGGATTALPVPGRYRLIAAGPAGPAAHIAAVYREISLAITEGRPAHPGFDTAVHHHRTLAAIERAAQTGVRQQLHPSAEPRRRAAAPAGARQRAAAPARARQQTAAAAGPRHRAAAPHQPGGNLA